MHVIQIFSDANLFAGMASDLNTTPPPDPNIYGMGAIPKRVHNINVVPSPPPSFLHGNLGALASQGNLGALASQGNLGALASPGSPSTPCLSVTRPKRTAVFSTSYQKNRCRLASCRH